jgi:hypothetical protein
MPSSRPLHSGAWGEDDSMTTEGHRENQKHDHRGH